MRITGGVLGGRRLRVPSGPVRPTQDRVREALFSSLAAFIPGARVLDLFAGSGAVGLEALSRGAAFVCWVESNRRVFAVLHENIRTLAGDASARMGPKEDAGGLPPGIDPAVAGLVLREALDFLSAAPPEAPFDLVFADPPYDRENR
ncbi:MAG: RsmD family RNA methyltransferase, partial [Lentisphaerae bacterium]|nr:RsmD family RNA methyltransferase [Lentisphaerota bacterium]